MLSIFASASVSLPPLPSPHSLPSPPLRPSPPSSLFLFLSLSLSLPLSLCLLHNLLFPVPEPPHPFSLFGFYCFCLSDSLCVRESLTGASGFLHVNSLYSSAYSSALRLVHIMAVFNSMLR